MSKEAWYEGEKIRGKVGEIELKIAADLKDTFGDTISTDNKKIISEFLSHEDQSDILEFFSQLKQQFASISSEASKQQTIDTLLTWMQIDDIKTVIKKLQPNDVPKKDIRDITNSMREAA